MATRDWLKKRGVTDERVLKAMAGVKREDFADPKHGLEYLPAPDVVGRMLQALHLSEDANVLQIGTGSGYTAALLSKLATAVFTVERDPVLARDASKRLAAGGFKNVQVLTGKTLRQYAANAPYDGIIVSASMAKLPQRLAKRLGVQGALVAPVGPHGKQKLVRLSRLTESNFHEETLGDLRVKPMLGDILVEMGVVDRHEVEMAALEADVKGKRLGEALLEGAYVEEADIYKALSKQNGVELYDAESLLRRMDRDLMQTFPRAFLLHSRIIPVRKEAGVLHLATSDVGLNPAEIAQAMGITAVSIGLITPTDYQLVWTTLDGPSTLSQRSAAEMGAGPSVVLDETGKFDAETIAFFQKLIIDAVNARASDIHFERHEQDVRVRFRVDGELQEPKKLPGALNPDMLAGIVQLVKVSARMEPSERRVPQSGHFQRRVDGQVFDVRARTQPTSYGETVVLRLLPQDAEVRSIQELGFDADAAAALEKALERRSGLILVVGPTGSGKSTTLFSALRTVAEDSRRKVISVEHPVTYALPNVHQVRISPNHGFDVPKAIEAVIADDADVLIVGDIKDAGVAEWAVRASQAGHLVLATVYGRDVVDGVRSLYQFDVDPNAIAAELVAVVAQRLAKRVCPECSEKVETTQDTVDVLFELDGNMPDDFDAFAGKGCDACGGRGTQGRVALTEFLELDADMRATITDRGTVESLRQSAKASGIKSMLENAVALVADGTIPQDELRWVPSWKH